MQAFSTVGTAAADWCAGRPAIKESGTSLEVQISYIKEYINHRDDLMLLDVFADKRCTGMNFDRPEFERLLKALQDRKVNCIVVKDFSRLGRNFVETGQYLEQVFPLFGVRFIAINDNYDSLNSQSRDGMLVPIEVFNDEHVKIHFTFENVLADYAE